MEEYDKRGATKGGGWREEYRWRSMIKWGTYGGGWMSLDGGRSTIGERGMEGGGWSTSGIVKKLGKAYKLICT